MKKNFWQDKTTRVYLWQVLATLIGVAGVFLADIPEQYQLLLTVVIVPLINATLKYINVRYFGDLGVEDIELKIKEKKEKESLEK